MLCGAEGVLRKELFMAAMNGKKYKERQKQRKVKRLWQEIAYDIESQEKGYTERELKRDYSRNKVEESIKNLNVMYKYVL